MKDLDRSIQVESGWYHEAHQAFVPGFSRGEGFCLFSSCYKAFLRGSQSFEPLEVGCWFLEDRSGLCRKDCYMACQVEVMR